MVRKPLTSDFEPGESVEGGEEGGGESLKVVRVRLFMDATADHYFPDPVSGQRGYYFCLAHHGPSSSVLKVNGCLKFPLGLPNESGGDAKKFPLICWLSWWFAIVKIFLFLNYG